MVIDRDKGQMSEVIWEAMGVEVIAHEGQMSEVIWEVVGVVIDLVSEIAEEPYHKVAGKA